MTVPEIRRMLAMSKEERMAEFNRLQLLRAKELGII
jgi:hypothetical protein